MPSNIYKKAIKKIEALPIQGTLKERLWVQKYLGSNKPTKCTRTGEIVTLARSIIKEESPNFDEYVELIDSLYKNAKSFQEIDLAARLLGAAPKLKEKVSPLKLNIWLNYTHGWAENDVLCQNNFTDKDMLGNWSVWKKLLYNLSKDTNVHKRRASLVLLNKPVRLSPDGRLSNAAFKNVDTLKNEEDILITKAISWILRSLIKYHKTEVANYLAKNRDLLPRIAVREVENKLATGKKYFKPSKPSSSFLGKRGEDPLDSGK